MRAPEHDTLVRFDRVERIVHWSNAALVLVLMGTGAVLYIGQLALAVGHRPVVKYAHIAAGLALPLPLLVGLVGRRGRRLRADLHTLGRFAPGEWRRLRRFRRASEVRLGKFNPGQKLNAAFLGGALAVMLAGGLIMAFPEPFAVDTRTGATFSHDWFAFGVWFSVLGHVGMALRDRVAMTAMRRGTVPTRWAREHRPGWFEEETGEVAPLP